MTLRLGLCAILLDCQSLRCYVCLGKDDFKKRRHQGAPKRWLMDKIQLQSRPKLTLGLLSLNN